MSALLCWPVVAFGQEDVEPNNECAQAQTVDGTITLPFVVNGSLDTPPQMPDVDFFRLTSEPGLELIAELKGASTGAGTLNDPFLGLFDAECNALAANDDFDSLDSQLRITVPNDGVFVLAASSCCDNAFAGTGGSAGTYELLVTQAPPPTCPPPTELSLPSSTQNTIAEDDCNAAELFGSAFQSGFIDQYVVTLPATGVLSLRVSTEGPRAYFEVWDEALDELVFAGYPFLALPGAAGSEFLLPGTYVILVSTVSPPPPTVSYTLEASFEETNVDPDVQLLAAVLPGSRSAQVGSGDYVTAFATIVNAGSETGIACGITPSTTVPARFSYRLNTGNDKIPFPANTTVDLGPYGGLANFVIAFLPDASFEPTEIAFDFACSNAAPAPVVSGLNTLLLSASADPVPDVMANAATLCNDGVVRLSPNTGVGVFAAAATNLGATDELTVSIDTGARSLPVSVSICETDPLGQCINPPSPSADPVPVTLETDAIATFGFFAIGSAPISRNAETNRLHVRFVDSNGVLRGATSVAVQTQGQFFQGCP